MLKIADNVDLKELEKFGFMDWDKKGAKVIYFKFIPLNAMMIQIINDRSIEFQLPIGSVIKKEDIKIENFIKDLIKAGIVVKE